ncbi:MAG: Gp15 family bacteriophage protein [Carnobacterium sp.]|uniref:Gp15 family bacteriophage protein n=1 Tax=Carnobacterium sp. TaxID=48221 RepID=UPI002FC9AF57
MIKNCPRWKKTFAKTVNREDWYDINDDWPLIEASFFKQYGIRLRTINDMPYDEFCSYLSGIMPDTPLGNIVQIRSEKDKEILKTFNDEQNKVRIEWLQRSVKKIDRKTNDDAIEQFKQIFKKLGGE